jgi:outer membrane protein assembly factor BamB
MPVRTPLRLSAISGLLALAALPVSAADWTQFRGPQRSGVSSETGWASRWSDSAPKTLWALEPGKSYACTLIAGDRAYITGSTKEKDTVYCLDADTGKEIWKVSFAHADRKAMAVVDAHSDALTSTPLLHKQRLYVLSREGELFCLDTKNGDTHWRKNLVKEIGAKLPDFGTSSSPVLEKNLLIFNIGTGGAAVDKDTGKVVWKSVGMGGYASPVLYTRNGKREAALFGVTEVVGVETATGKEQWRYPWKVTGYTAPSADPVLFGDRLLVHSATRGAHLLLLGSAAPTVVWQNKNMCSDFTNSVLWNGYLYGNNNNKLTCLDMKTGKTAWEEKGLGQGCLIIAGGKLIVQTQRGELIIAEANPEKYQELGRVKLFEGKDFMGSAGFITPTLANGKLYCRVPSGKLVCLDVREK